VSLYVWLKIAKLCAVLAYVGALASVAAQGDIARRRVLIHRVASPALLAVWTFGYALVLVLGVPLFELWPCGGVVLSIAAQGAVIAGSERGVSGRQLVLRAAVPLVSAVALMVLRPSWSSLRP
jgi:hypothetical protein